MGSRAQPVRRCRRRLLARRPPRLRALNGRSRPFTRPSPNLVHACRTAVRPGFSMPFRCLSDGSRSASKALWSARATAFRRRLRIKRNALHLERGRIPSNERCLLLEIPRGARYPSELGDRAPVGTTAGAFRERDRMRARARRGRVSQWPETQARPSRLARLARLARRLGPKMITLRSAHSSELLWRPMRLPRRKSLTSKRSPLSRSGHASRRRRCSR